MHRLTSISSLILVVLMSAACALSERRVIRLPDANPELPYSNGILVDGTLYLAGRLGLDPATNAVPEDPAQEVRNAMDGIVRVLEAAGMTTDDLVSVTVYCSDVSLYATFNEVYGSYFPGGDFPARAFVGSGPLLRGARFEIQSVAVRR